MDLSETGPCSSGSRSSPRATTRAPITRPPPPSSPTKCAICLGDLVNRCYTNSCLHQFCFPCLHEWSKVKPECPLCKSHFQTIYHNIRNNDDFDEYRVPVLNLPPSISNLSIRDPFGTTFSVESYPHPFPAHTHMHIFREPPQGGFGSPYHHDHGYSFHRLVRDHRHHQSRSNPQSDYFHIFPPRHQNPPGFENQVNPFHSDEPETFGSYEENHQRAIEIMGYQRRRRIYDRNQFVEPFSRTLPPGTVFFPSVEYFHSHPRSARRVKSWLHREILVLCSLSRSRTEMAHLYDTILNMLIRYDIRSVEFREVVQPYFQNRTRHFQHEFYHFVLSGMGVLEYDSSATYNTTSQEDPRLSRSQDVPSSSSAATTSRPPEPEVVTIDSESDSDSDISISLVHTNSAAEPQIPSVPSSRASGDIVLSTSPLQTPPTISLTDSPVNVSVRVRPRTQPLSANNNSFSPPLTQSSATRPSFSLTSIYTLSGPVGNIIDEGYVVRNENGQLQSHSQGQQRELENPHYHRVPVQPFRSSPSDYYNHPRFRFPRPGSPNSPFTWNYDYNNLHHISTTPPPLDTFAPSSHADPVTNSDYIRRHQNSTNRTSMSLGRPWNMSASAERIPECDYDDTPSPLFRPMVILPTPDNGTNSSAFTRRRTPPASPTIHINPRTTVEPISPFSGCEQEHDSDSDEIELIGTFPVEKKPPLATITISSDSEDESKRVKVEKGRKSPETRVLDLDLETIDDAFFGWTQPPIINPSISTSSNNNEKEQEPQPSTSRELVKANTRGLRKRASDKRTEVKIQSSSSKRRKVDENGSLRRSKRQNKTTKKIYNVESESSSGCLDLSLQLECTNSNSSTASSSSSHFEVPRSGSKSNHRVLASSTEFSSSDDEGTSLGIKLKSKLTKMTKPQLKVRRTKSLKANTKSVKQSKTLPSRPKKLGKRALITSSSSSSTSTPSSTDSENDNKNEHETVYGNNVLDLTLTKK